jgi:hypothetical protein
MYKLATIAALLKRVRRKRELAACAMAALFFLSAWPRRRKLKTLTEARPWSMGARSDWCRGKR